MDPSRYGRQQEWDNNSAPEGYGTQHDPNHRFGVSYDDGYPDERLMRDDVYNYPPGHNTLGDLPQSRKRNYEENYPSELRRQEKPYIDSNYAADYYHDSEAGSRNGHYRDHEHERSSRYDGCDDYSCNDNNYRSKNYHHSRDDGREKDYDYTRRSYDSEYERASVRDGSRKSRDPQDRERNSRDREWDSRDREWDKRCYSRERDESPHKRYEKSRSRSTGRGEFSRSRSPRGRSHGRSYREDSYEGDHWNESERRREYEDRHNQDHFSATPSATVVVKGLSMKSTEEDLYQILAEWGPLHHVRVIREQNSGISRGFAFIDFPTVDAARTMMDRIEHDGIVLDGRKLMFHYSQPTGRAGVSRRQEHASRRSYGGSRNMIVPTDWICTICGCINFARRTSCFQCNEPKTKDSPSADVGLSNSAAGKRISETGPTHVLVVRGLDEDADEEMLRYEFSKHAPIKDLRLVRDKFTHVSRGFAFVHFYSVEDATKALEATNRTALERNGKILRVAYAKSVHGSGTGISAPSHSNNLAAAAIEAATFSQQYDGVGWAPKEYNTGEKQNTGGQAQGVGEIESQKGTSAPQSGYVWDEASGYYYDAASGYYYDGNSGLYYDSNSGLWYSYDQQTQQYVPCPDQNNESKVTENQPDSAKKEKSSQQKVIISAATTPNVEKVLSLPDAVQAAAAAAIASEKREKERVKEIKLASKTSLLASKKKMSNVLTMWKQRSHETQIQRPSPSLGDNPPTVSAEARSSFSTGQSMGKLKSDVIIAKERSTSNHGVSALTTAESSSSSTTGGTLMGVMRGSFGGTLGGASSSASVQMPPILPSASPASVSVSGSGRRRFSETPTAGPTHREQPQTSYRDRAAESLNPREIEMFRAVGSALKRNKEAFNGIARGFTTSSHRVFTSNITAASVTSASSSPLAGNSFYGLRSLLKGQNASMFRRMSTVASISSESKEGLKLLVTGGPQAQKWVGIWLFGSAAWVFSMVVLGGVTRLTRSGLSMTDWKFTGEFPPLSDEAWAKEFEKYKQSPEYKRVNKGMNLEDFKFIYWMEYAHRMWGRGLGIMFALPFSYFLRKGYITLRLGVQLSGLFALGAGQGFIGWWMVKSGLEEPPSEYSQPRVSPYRLAAHLTSAFAIYCGLFWTALSVVMPEPPAESLAWVRGAAKVKKLALPVSLIVGITAISGAFVAGNDAGRAFNTFPKMGDTWIPDNIFEMKPLLRNFFENTATVQLDHRLLATTTLIAIGTMWWFTRKLDIHPAVKALIGSTVGMTAVQVTLGVSTLLSYVPVSLGSAHQAGALTLLTLMLLLNHTLRRPSPSLLKSLPQVAKSNFS